MVFWTFPQDFRMIHDDPAFKPRGGRMNLPGIKDPRSPWRLERLKRLQWLQRLRLQRLQIRWSQLLRWRTFQMCLGLVQNGYTYYHCAWFFRAPSWGLVFCICGYPVSIVSSPKYINPMWTLDRDLLLLARRATFLILPALLARSKVLVGRQGTKCRRPQTMERELQMPQTTGTNKALLDVRRGRTDAIWRRQ